MKDEKQPATSLAEKKQAQASNSSFIPHPFFLFRPSLSAQNFSHFVIADAIDQCGFTELAWHYEA